ncbi:hypothetical protein [Dermatobacter hominis]|uniref:hypothetical protein n=1 Tax=Dermatobacter hominis TaxID=2884263 RepID=UPI001D120950|nr:hypothetical protein [Dermatobacter hominis]UDY36082.1 hypothetical protein LH044_00770 [Dermatobacter hominis]
MEEKAILVMWDYSAYPLWSTGPMQANLFPGRLPLSDALRGDLNEWAADMERLMAPGARQKPKWEPDPQELDDLNRRGQALAQRVKDELGTEWSVSYHDESTGERVDMRGSTTSTWSTHGRRRR